MTEMATAFPRTASARRLASEPLLEVRDLVVDFQGSQRTLRAVDHVSFRVGYGGSLGIVGESGSGKSVTARAIMGLLAQNATWQGDIHFDGTDLSTLPAEERRRLRGRSMAMIFQDPLSFLNPVLTIGSQIAETLHYHQGLSWKDCHQETIRLMDRVGIPLAAKRSHDYPHQFSGGMRQRAMIAMAIALKPKILIADEPTTALDVTVQAQVLDLLMHLREEEGMALVLISHDLAVVAEVADTVAVMYAGRVIETGTIETVYREPTHPYTHGLLNAIPRIDQIGRALTIMSGTPPLLTSVPPGCRFHPRCVYAQEICHHTEPVLQVDPNGSSSACHFSRASRWTKPR